MLEHRSRRRKPAFLLGIFVAFALVAGACGDDDDDDTSTGDTTQTTAGGATTTGQAATTVPNTAPPSDLEPQPGGKVVFGLEADSSTPWTPAKVLCAVSCYQVARTVMDQLVMVTADGEIVPYLAESMEPNADFTVWTMKLRSGIKFHDGTDFNAAAVVDNVKRHQASFLTAKAIADMKKNPDGTFAEDSVVAVDDLTVEFKMQVPWVAFPIYLAGQLGLIGSPTWLAAADADPSLEPKPVGTGPFIFVDYKPGELFRAKKNPDYWNQPYPYLDEVELRPIPDALTRKSALETGDIDILHSTNGESIAEWREADPEELTYLETNKYGETGYTLLHVTQEGSPLTDARIRCAMANSYDSQAIIDQIGAGVTELANGPFSPGQPGNMPDSGFPTAQNMDKAKELVASWKADNPGVSLDVKLSTTQDQTNLVIAQAQKEWFLEAGFDNVEISQIEQGVYILTALQGDFQAFQWRNHGGFVLDQQYIWWHSRNADPIGALAINFGRIKDPQIDSLLDENRGEPDPVKQQENAEAINRIFGEQCYNLWGSWTVWGVAAQPKVHITNLTSPEGTEIIVNSAGAVNLSAVWVEQ